MVDLEGPGSTKVYRFALIFSVVSYIHFTVDTQVLSWRMGRDVEQRIGRIQVSRDLSDPIGANGTFERYVEVKELARGGMGVVYRGTDPDLERPVAIKLIQEESSSLEGQGFRFLREARILGQLIHPSIPPIHELGRTRDGRSYFVMRMVEGRSLEEILATQGTLQGSGFLRRTRADLLRILIKVCEAVAFAHSRGVIHRDLKPSNIMVGAYGEVLVMDWGIAKIVTPDDKGGAFVHQPLEWTGGSTGSFSGISSTPEEIVDLDETMPGTMMGTPGYMPPEQARGNLDAIGPRSDVFGLGAILFEILTFSPPVVASSLQEFQDHLLAGHIEPPSARAPWAGIPKELDAVVLRATAHLPRDRFRSAMELAENLEAFLSGRALSAYQYNPLQRGLRWIISHRITACALLAVILTSLVFLSIFHLQRSSEREERIAQAMLEAEEVLSSDGSSISDYLTTASTLDRALPLAPEDGSLLQRRREVGIELGRVALDSGDYNLARLAFLDLSRYGMEQAEIEGFMDLIEKTRTAALQARAARLEEILEDLTLDPSREDRDPGAPLLEDHVFEAAGFFEVQTVEILGRALKPFIVRAGSSQEKVTWSEGEKRVIRFASRVLGRIGSRVPEAVMPLSEWMGVVRDESLAVEAGLALCNTRQGSAQGAVFKACLRFGVNSTVWKRIARRVPRIPDPGDPGRTDSPEGLLFSAFFKAQKQDYSGAIEDYTRALEIDPRSTDIYLNRGNARYALGDREGAIVDFRTAIELDPGSWQGWTNLGAALATRGGKKEAREAFMEALRHAPPSERGRIERDLDRLGD